MKIIFVLALGALALAQSAADRITVPFSDPARPKTVRGSLMNACFVVEGYDGKELIVETRAGSDESRRNRVPRVAEGMKRIEANNFGLSVEEDSNTVKIGDSGMHSGSVLLRVPRETNVNLKCLNGGELKATGITGDLELNNTNASVNATNVSGSVLAHSLNGKVTVSLDRITPSKPMSFSTLNGDIDVTLPADTHATLRMKSDNGEIFTDFEVRLTPNASQPMVEDNRGKGGRYRVKLEKATVGTINGGGPDMSFKTLNGNIFVRQRK